MNSASYLRRLALVLILSAAALSGYYWWRLSLGYDQLRAATLAQAHQRIGQLVQAEEGHIETLLLGIDLALRQFRDAVQAGNPAAAAGVAGTAKNAFPAGAVVRFAMFDTAGAVEYSDGNVAGPVDVREREYFKFHRDNGADRLFIAKPFFGKVSGNWVVLLTRPVFKQGRFAGVAAVSLSVDYLADSLARLQMGAGDVVTLVYSDGTYMARSRDLKGVVGKSLPSNRPLLAPGAPAQGIFRAAGNADNVPRIFAWSRMAGYPLIVVVGLDEGSILAPVEREIERSRAHNAIGMSLLLALVAVVALLLMRTARQQNKLAQGEAMLRSTLDATADGILVVGRDGAIVNANRRFYEIWRIPDEVVGIGDDERLLACAQEQLSDPDGFLRLVRELYQTDVERTDTVFFKDGRVFERYTRAFLLGRQRVRLWSFRDVTANRRMEQALREQEVKYRTLFDTANDGIFLQDASGFVECNRRGAAMYGLPPERIVGRQPAEFSPERQPDGRLSAEVAAEKVQAALQGQVQVFEWQPLRADGTPFDVEITLNRLDMGGATYMQAIVRDITERKRHEAELNRIAYFDPLTGVPNRRLLADRLGQAIAHASRSGKPLGVCYLDLDGFKPINDRFGHAAGDQLLIEIAARLQGLLRAEDTLARLGGDEFVLLLADLARPEESHVVLDRILAAIAAPLLVDGVAVDLSASIGVTLTPPDEPDADILLRHADQAMYRAKEAGKNRYHLFDPEQGRQIQAHRHQLQRLEEALREREFVLHYQPKVDLASGAVVGAEALIRWQHPQDGLLAPAAFLHYLDGSDLEIAVGEWVIESALQQLASWQSAGLSTVVSVNIDANHLLQPDFTARLRLALERHAQIAPANLELEILETAALSDMERATRTLVGCRDLGVRFALDDFGTGYSSLAYFRSLPVDILKIDQSFVRDMLDDPNDLDMVESVVRLAHAFNRPVIAEGVETLEHGALLMLLGCRLCQGYGIARPMPAAELPAWIERWRSQAAWVDMERQRGDRADISLTVAAQSHRKWVARLVASLENRDMAAMDELARQCRFGHWYQGSGTTRYGTLPEFQAIAPIHDRLHALAGELMDMVRAGRDEAAQARMPELYAVRDSLLRQIDALGAKTVDSPA